MLSRLFSLIAVLCLLPALHAQSVASSRFQLYGGYSMLSNTINGVSGSHQSMNGWDASLAFPSWHGLRFKVDAFGYTGTNLGAYERPYFILGGGQYSHHLGRESIYVEGLGGDGNVNKNWGPNKAIGGNASFSAILGGGLDTPLSRHFAFRVGGDFQYANFYLVTAKFVNYKAPGQPIFFGRVTSGLVWGF